MKTLILTIIFLSLAMTGCDKQSGNEISNTQDPNVIDKFEKSDAIIGGYLDKLDSPDTAKTEQINIICNAYPAEYKSNYMPALLKLQPKAYTEEQLLKDLDMALNYYKEKLSITCQ